MSTIKYTTALAFAAIILTIVSCTKDFDVINTNNNAPETVTAQLLLPGIQRDMMGAVLGEAWGIGNIVVQHTAKNQFVNEDRYLWGEINSIWNNVYDNMRDVYNIIQLADNNGDKATKGLALTMKSWMYSLATDCYGDIPYTEAIQAKQGVFYAKYDTQEEIYEGILKDLEEANTLFASSSAKIGGDLIYGGDPAKWRKLANSLRVRYLMRISGKKDVKARLATIINDPVNHPVFKSVADNATYNYKAASPDQFPLFSSRIGSFNEFRASKTLLDTLQSLRDPRLSIFFRPTPKSEGTANPVFIGIPNGLDDVTALTYAGGAENQSRISAYYFENVNTPEGIAVAKGVIMTYAELQFLLAEAAAKSLITGDANQYYNEGIKASYAFYGLTPTSEYLNQTEVKLLGNVSDLQKIGFQKWISFFYQGLEAWFDWRRTGIPALKPSVSNQNGNKIPVRFIYPIIEQGLNGDNRAQAVARQGEDDINTKMWSIK